MKRMMLDQGPDPRVHPEAPGCCEQEPVCRPTGEWILTVNDMRTVFDAAYDHGHRSHGFEEWAEESGVV